MKRIGLFKVPLLPWEWYSFIKRLSQNYGVSPRQVVIAGLRALKDVGPAAGSELLDWSKTTFPDNWDPKGWSPSAETQ